MERRCDRGSLIWKTRRRQARLPSWKIEAIAPRFPASSSISSKMDKVGASISDKMTISGGRAYGLKKNRAHRLRPFYMARNPSSEIAFLSEIGVQQSQSPTTHTKLPYEVLKSRTSCRIVFPYFRLDTVRYSHGNAYSIPFFVHLFIVRCLRAWESTPLRRLLSYHNVSVPVYYNL